MNPITSTPVKGNKKITNPLSQYVPDCLSLEIAMERYCKMHWNSSSSSRRSSSEPIGSLVDSGRSSLTSYGSEESLSSDELEVFSDSYSDFEEDDECNSSIAGELTAIISCVECMQWCVSTRLILYRSFMFLFYQQAYH